MISDSRQIKIIPKRDQDQLIKNMSKNKKHLLITLLMIDCGLRVSEVARLQVGHFDFKNSQLIIPSLKKRKAGNKPVRDAFRTIPMTRRVIDALSNYYVTLKNRESTDYVFPAKSKSGHMRREAIWKFIKKKSVYGAYPHMLRHTFATKIVNEGNDIRVAQNLLGHRSFKTTEIYLHIAESEKRAAIRSIDQRSLYLRLKDRFFPRRRVFQLDTTNGLTGIHVGRKDELMKLHDLYNKRVNVLVTGDQGIGKSELLNQIQGDKVLRLDDFSGVKKTLGNILLHLHQGDKGKIIDLLTKDADINRVMTRESISRIVELISKVVEPKEYTLVIDDLSNVTKGGIVVLEKLKNVFHIIAAARRIKINQSSFLTNFQKLEVGSLQRHEATKLIMYLTKNMRDRVEDFETFKNHIYEQTNGNPMYIYELVERFGKEPDITIEQIRDIRHHAAYSEIDISIPIVVMISSLMVLRYIGGEFEDDSGAFKLFGGAFLLFALFARNIFKLGKRKYA